MHEKCDIAAPTWNVLYLPTFLPAVHYRAYADRIGDFCLLGWLIERLCRRVHPASLIVLSHDERDTALAHAEADRFGVAVFRGGDGSRLQTLSDLAAALPGSHIACFYPEFAFAPSRLLSCTWEHHMRMGNQYTCSRGVPAIAGVEIFAADLLAAIGRIRFDGAAPDLTDTVERLIALQRRSGGAEQVRAVPYIAASANPGRECCGLLIHTALDASRARASLCNLPKDYGLEAIDGWVASRGEFEPPRFDRRLDARPRILYISAWSGYSGSEECLANLVTGIRTHGFSQAALIGCEGWLADRVRRAGADVFCPNWHFEYDTDNGRRFAAELLASAAPSLIHCNSTPGPGVRDAARASGIPVLAHVRVADLRLFTNDIEYSDHIIAISNFVRAQLLAARVPDAKISVVLDGVDPVRFRPGVYDRGDMRARLGISSDAFVIVQVARVVKSKRHDLLLRAAKQALHSVPALKVIFVGVHGEPAVLRELADLQRELQLDSVISWIPFQEDIRRVECAADAMVLCSHREALGQCVLEGMSLGLPVIVGDSGGSPEVIEDGISGLVMPAGDADALSSAIVRLGQSAELRAELGRRARMRVEEQLTIQMHAARMAEVFRGVVSRVHVYPAGRSEGNAPAAS